MSGRRKSAPGRAPKSGERRKADRRGSARLPIEMWVEQSHGAELYFQRAGNLSAGGLSLENTIPHPIGTTVALSFTLPGDTQPISARGEVVNALCEGALGMGIKFLDLDSKIAARITTFVKDRAKRDA